MGYLNRKEIVLALTYFMIIFSFVEKKGMKN